MSSNLGSQLDLHTLKITFCQITMTLKIGLAKKSRLAHGINSEMNSDVTIYLLSFVSVITID